MTPWFPEPSHDASDPNLLDRLGALRDQAHRFGDDDLALTAHDARLVVIHLLGLTMGMRNVMAEQATTIAKQRLRIRDQVELIRQMRAQNDPAHVEHPSETEA